MGRVSLRSYRTSWKQKVNIPGSYRVFWDHTCDLFTPQTGAVIFTLLLFYSRGGFHIHCSTSTICPIFTAYTVHNICYIINELLPLYSVVGNVLTCMIHLSSLFFRLSSVDISHIQGNLEEISTFQQMLVQSLEEHTKSVSHHFLYTKSYVVYTSLNTSCIQSCNIV